MEMSKKPITSFVPGVGFALLINIFLFALLPQFVEKGANKNDLETLIPINVIQFKRPKLPPPKEEKEELPEKKEPEKVIPTVRLKFHKRQIPKKLELEVDMPSLSFEINPGLKVGMPVAPPPKEKTITTHEGPYLQGEVDQIPVVILRTKPFYPFRARVRNITGKVEVKFLVDENGYVSKVKILKSKPPEIFDESVLKALPSWRFSPGKVRGKNISTWVVTTIRFRLEG